MICKQCGVPLPSNQELCNNCLKIRTDEITSISSRLSIQTPFEKEQEYKKKKHLKWIIFLGFVCPLIWIGYVIYLIAPSIPKLGISHSDTTPKTNQQPKSDIINTPTQSHEFTFYDPAGNYCKSGGVFVDWAGNLIEWGGCFRDSRGNLIEWGQPFYDSRDNYCTWGSPFYDSRGNYIVP